SSRSEQFPISVVEAMAAGLPVVAPAVGDVAEMVASENAELIVPAGDEAALGWALGTLCAKPGRAPAIGGANHKKAQESYDEARMIARYRALYLAAIGGKPLG